ncbi:DNA-directed RNA polymerase V subunit 5A [Cajanus cajan]|uniref:DNA-directed RNA polymerases I, II, and III subunit RPABC1 n=1 Tax=Cajanus cajan TaxID=3821 RepID=A0A151T6Z8_CAJCA|nr:DNA-directed RNA polymerase V subunit 5A [Cajanus cajan]KYP62807.1 DNA-directed RNA polymerases I, II, and III subunit RPABC1 [Cajanus cajan]
MACVATWVDRGSTESHRYFLSRRTVLEMLHDRGYDVLHHASLTPSLNDFRSRFGQQPNHQALGFCVSHLSHPSNMVQVVFTGSDHIRKGTVSEIFNLIVDRENLKALILIVQSKMTSFARKDLETCPFKVEIFRITDLLVNITKHVLQPKHEVLTDDEKKALLTKYSLEDKQLPLILKTDAIARYYGYEKGQVIKITHSGPLIESYVSYRCVV